MRLEAAAAHRDACRHLRELQRRCQHIALADAGVERFARIPVFVAVLALPFARRIQTVLLQRPVDAGGVRSEEHTSELQSLLRTSSAVFCFKKKNTHNLSYASIH